MESHKITWNAQLKPKKGEKGRGESKNKCNETKTIINIVDINPVILMIILNQNALNISGKRQRLSGWVKIRVVFMLSIWNPLQAERLRFNIKGMEKDLLTLIKRKNSYFSFRQSWHQNKKVNQG